MVVALELVERHLLVAEDWVAAVNQVALALLAGELELEELDARLQEDIENMFRLYFLRQNNIQLLTKINDIRIFGDTAAELDLTVGMAGTNDGTLGFSADAYNFELELILDGDDWILTTGRWGEVGGDMR